MKSEEQQAAAIVFRARDLLVRQRTQTINALRGHLTEFGVVAAQVPPMLPNSFPRSSAMIPTFLSWLDRSYGCSSSSCDP